MIMRKAIVVSIITFILAAFIVFLQEYMIKSYYCEMRWHTIIKARSSGNLKQHNFVGLYEAWQNKCQP